MLNCKFERNKFIIITNNKIKPTYQYILYKINTFINNSKPNIFIYTTIPTFYFKTRLPIIQILKTSTLKSTS